MLLVLPHAGFFRHFDGVVRHLCDEGERVTVVRGPVGKENVTEAALVACSQEMQTCETAHLLRRSDVWGRVLSTTRTMRDFAVYEKPEHASPSLRYRFQGSLPLGVRRLSRSARGRRLLAAPLLRRALELIESVAPPDANILRDLSTREPDVVVASPYILKDSMEVDYVKAARALGIPTVAAVASWDNLTTKGTFQILPDFTFVWNDPLRREATAVHDVPEERIFPTGAPTFDPWFVMRPAEDAATFRARAGLDPDADYVLYVCSSSFIAGDETSFVSAFADALQRDERTARIGLMVRPHPFNASIWDRFSRDGLAVWPPRGAYPDMADAQQAFFDALYHSRAVVGVNTSAFLEAAVVDRPCVTIVTPRYHATQQGIGHFRHLLDAGFLEVSTSPAEAAAALARVLQGQDDQATRRRQFVADFLRPQGLSYPASTVMAAAIQAVAGNPRASTEDVCQAVKARLASAEVRGSTVESARPSGRGRAGR